MLPPHYTKMYVACWGMPLCNALWQHLIHITPEWIIINVIFYQQPVIHMELLHAHNGWRQICSQYTYNTVKDAHINFFPKTSPRTQSFHDIYAAFIYLHWKNGNIINYGNTIYITIKHSKASGLYWKDFHFFLVWTGG